MLRGARSRIGRDLWIFLDERGVSSVMRDVARGVAGIANGNVKLVLSMHHGIRPGYATDVSHGML